MEMTTGAVTAISTRLVDAALMRRVDHPNDRRSLLLELTPSGDEVMKQIYREFDAALAVVTKDIAEADLRGCSTLLRSAAEELVPLDSSVF